MSAVIWENLTSAFLGEIRFLFFCIFELKKLFSIMCVKISRESSVNAEILQFIEWMEKPNKSTVICKT